MDTFGWMDTFSSGYRLSLIYISSPWTDRQAIIKTKYKPYNKWTVKQRTKIELIWKPSPTILIITEDLRFWKRRFLIKQQHSNTCDLVLTWSLGRIHRSLRCYQYAPASCTDANHELGWSKEEKLRGVCSLHRGDAYPNTSTNSWDGGLVAQESVGNKTVWVPAWDSSLFYLSDSGAASRGNPCLKQWPSLFFSS